MWIRIWIRNKSFRIHNTGVYSQNCPFIPGKFEQCHCAKNYLILTGICLFFRGEFATQHLMALFNEYLRNSQNKTLVTGPCGQETSQYPHSPNLKQTIPPAAQSPSLKQTAGTGVKLPSRKKSVDQQNDEISFKTPNRKLYKDHRDQLLDSQLLPGQLTTSQLLPGQLTTFQLLPRQLTTSQLLSKQPQSLELTTSQVIMKEWSKMSSCLKDQIVIS